MSLLFKIWNAVREHLHPQPIKILCMPVSISFRYTDYNGNNGVCWLQLYRSKEMQNYVAVATDLMYRMNFAASVTDFVEIVTEIVTRFDLEPWEIVLIGHHDWRGTSSTARPGNRAHTFDHVKLQRHAQDNKFVDPVWARMSEQQVEDLLEGSLEDDILQKILAINWRVPVAARQVALDPACS